MWIGLPWLLFFLQGSSSLPANAMPRRRWWEKVQLMHSTGSNPNCLRVQRAIQSLFHCRLGFVNEFNGQALDKDLRKHDHICHHFSSWMERRSKKMFGKLWKNRKNTFIFIHIIIIIIDIFWNGEEQSSKAMASSLIDQSILTCCSQVSGWLVVVKSWDVKMVAVCSLVAKVTAYVAALAAAFAGACAVVGACADACAAGACVDACADACGTCPDGHSHEGLLHLGTCFLLSMEHIFFSEFGINLSPLTPWIIEIR